MWNPTKEFPRPPRLTFLSEAPIPRKNTRSLVVDHKIVCKPSQILAPSKCATRILPGDPEGLGFPTNPRATSLLDELKGNDVWLSGIIDRDLLLFSTEGNFIVFGRIRYPQELMLQQWSVLWVYFMGMPTT
jgi:hypothetical protein